MRPDLAGLDLVASAEDIAATCTRIAGAISLDHPSGVTLIGVLPDSVLFLADLVRAITVPTEIDFVAVAPYDGHHERTRLTKDLDRTIEGRAVVLVAVLVDTGLSLDYLRRHVAGFGPASLRIAALADRPSRRIVPVALAYRGLEVAGEHLVGYGLDQGGRCRNLPDLWRVDPSGPDLGRLFS